MGDEDSGDEDGDADPSVPSSRKASIANLAAAGPTEPATPIKAGAPPKVAKAAKPGALKDKKKALRRRKQEELARLQRELAAGPVTELDYTVSREGEWRMGKGMRPDEKESGEGRKGPV